MSITELYANSPPWLLRHLPTNASHDAKLAEKIDTLAEKLPDSLWQLNNELNRVAGQTSYDDAANRACAKVWAAIEVLMKHPQYGVRSSLYSFARSHFPPVALARVLRRLVKDRDYELRRQVRRHLEASPISEVALPRAGADAPWDSSGWAQGTTGDTVERHAHGPRTQARFDLPRVTNVRELRDLLGIRRPSQLGYLLLASEGPYRTFVIPKRNGTMREIAAPSKQLRYVQRQILHKILDKIPPHAAAHGFIRDRSTVTNAQPHVGAALLVKFDLEDFFPTIHYHRVMGLFASLGYSLSDGRFSSDDDSIRVAPTLARLCVFAKDPQAWSGGVMPQGAPTSPAISNLICRGLDARLEGLARQVGAVYTRYADDLTFSFRKDEVHVGRFRWWVDQICHQEGFLIHQDKFRVIRPSQRQCVTGIVVNEALHVPRRDRRRFRAMLHNCREHGVATQMRGNPAFASYLRGFASYLNMVQAEDGARILAEVRELLARDGGAP